MVYQDLAKAVVKVLVRLVGGRLNERRRRDILRSLREQGLDDEEVAELGPFVQAAVEHGGVTKKLLLVFGWLLVGAFELLGVVLIRFDALLLGFGVLLLGAGLLWAIRRGVQRNLKLAGKLEAVLRQNPRWLLRPEYTQKYQRLLDDIDHDPETYGSYDDVAPPPAPGGAPGPAHQPASTAEPSGGTPEPSGGTPEPSGGTTEHPADASAAHGSATHVAERAAGSGSRAAPAGEKLRSRLYGLEATEFRQFVAALWRRMGWQTETAVAGDERVIVATSQGPSAQRLAIATRHEAEGTALGKREIDDVASLRQQYRADSVVVVTTARFTTPAEQRADELRVKLVDGKELVGTIEEFESRDLLKRHLQMQRRTPETAGGPSESVGATSESEGATSGRSATGFGRWHWVATGVGLLAFVLGNGSLLAFLALVLVAAATLYVDIRHVRRRSTWSPRAWFYVPGALVLLSLPVYLVNRYRYVPNE